MIKKKLRVLKGISCYTEMPNIVGSPVSTITGKYEDNLQGEKDTGHSVNQVPLLHWEFYLLKVNQRYCISKCSIMP